MISIADSWKDYEVLATGNGEKLERWGEYVLLRPDPQVIWPASKKLEEFKGLNAQYVRDASGGGSWKVLKKLPESWIVSWKTLKFVVKPMSFKHTGIFPEQAANWEKIQEIIRLNTDSGKEIKVLNLFAYTGGATLAAAAAGASVCHVDASKGMVFRAKENAELSGLKNAKIRWIVDDCRKFVEREIKRKNFYDCVIMDPPSYGRGTSGELWKLEDNLFEFVELCSKVLSDKPLFILLNSYTTGLSGVVLENVLNRAIDMDGKTSSFDLVLPTKEKGILLPCGSCGWKIFERTRKV